MSSELKVNKVSPESGTGVQLGDSGDTITIPAGATITNSGTATGFGETDTNVFRNIIINGDMALAQRATSAAAKTSDGYYTMDRFEFAITSLGTWTFSQSTDVPSAQGFATSLKADCTSADGSPAADDRIFLRQSFEGQNLQYLKKGTSSAVALTLSFWVKSNKTGTYICELYDHDNSRHINLSYTISSASTWEKKTLTFAGDTTGAFTNDENLSLHVAWWLGAGSTYTSGTLQTAWGSATNANRAVGQVNLADNTSNEWYMTGAQLEVGENASDFAIVPFEVTFERCKRYYEVVEGGKTFYNSGTHDPQVTVPYSVKKRASPTLTKESSTENCASSVSVVAGQLTATINGQVKANNAFATGANKLFYARFNADAEL